MNNLQLSLVIGCGYTSQRKLCSCNQILALDLDCDKILCAKKSDPKAFYLNCDVRFLPFREGMFFDIICSDILEHIRNYTYVLKKILQLRPIFIYLRFPTETREKLLVKISRVYAEQIWGKIHIGIVDVQKITKILESQGYIVEIELTSAGSTLMRIFLQKILEIFHITYAIPDIGLVVIPNEKSIHKLLIYFSSVIAHLGKLSYYFWKLFKIKTLNDNYIVKAKSKSFLANENIKGYPASSSR